jgi:hypothetical protein
VCDGISDIGYKGIGMEVMGYEDMYPKLIRKMDKILKIENYDRLNFQPVNGDWVLMTTIEFDDTYQFKVANKITYAERWIELERKSPKSNGLYPLSLSEEKRTNRFLSQTTRSHSTYVSYDNIKNKGLFLKYINLMLVAGNPQ